MYKVVIIQVHAPGGLSWVQNACLETTKIDVDSFERCFASHIAHNIMHNVHNVRTYVRNTHQYVYCDHAQL